MELFKRQHYSLWIICIVMLFIRNGYGLQGVPTWICLGIKSPFIEFKAEAEVLSNVSVSLNSSTTEKGLNKNGIQSLGPFVYPIDQYNDTSKSKIINKNKHVIRIKNKETNVIKQNKVDITENPVVADINSKKEVTIIEIHSDDDYTDDKTDTDRKYIIPLALKNPTVEPRKNPIFQDSSTNIDDLKRHILMLQNLTKNDQNFQSKFVVFPNLQRNSTDSAQRTTVRPNLYRSTTSYNIPKANTAKQILREAEADIHKPEKITIVPQVFLQNDQTPMNDDSFESRSDSKKEIKTSYTSRNKYRKKFYLETTTATFRPTSRFAQRRQKSGFRRNRNLRKKKCRGVLNKNQNCTMTEKSTDNFSNFQNKTTYVYDAELNKQAIRQGNFTKLINYQNDNVEESRKLSRMTRSQHRNATRDLIFPSVVNINQTNNLYKENIDLNPDLCYKVGGLSYGQQKLCVLHTHIMPAVSRGARAAIQECRHQFRNRRWNCSTVDDVSVFGPITGIGSPEMAFVHAIAAAGAASFIARACRDGQLTSCGCSRSSRPKQLHDDWTWGGCGDDLEFGYKFSQNFIDIREKERKRGIRGLVSIPQKFPKLEEKLLTDGLNETNKSDTENGSKGENTGPFKPEDLLELQEKITKEILNSKLQEKEMHELQAKINKELLNSKVFNLEHQGLYGSSKKKAHQKTGSALNRIKTSGSSKARSMMNLHNNEAGRRAVIKKSRITCKCHGVSGSCSLITCWQQLTSMREIGDYLREKYDESTQVKMNKRGRLQVKDPRYKVPTALDLVYLDESPDWCRLNRQLQWSGTHNRVCNKSSSGLDGCAILCCGRGYNTKKIVVKERCNCKFHWCCHVKCDTCVKVIEEYSCK